MKSKFFRKGDIIAVAVIAVLCIALFLGLYVFNSHKGTYVQIEQDGSVIETLPLDKDTEYNVEIDGKVTNTVQIKGGEVSVSYADCPDQICANHAPVSLAGESIICLPNKVVVSVVGSDGNESQPDGVAR